MMEVYVFEVVLVRSIGSNVFFEFSGVMDYVGSFINVIRGIVFWGGKVF